MALFRRIRLQQVHEVLSNPGLRQQLGCHTVHQAAEYFGFASRNHYFGVAITVSRYCLGAEFPQRSAMVLRRAAR